MRRLIALYDSPSYRPVPSQPSLGRDRFLPDSIVQD
jgi:hypothetical protein